MKLAAEVLPGLVVSMGLPAIAWWGVRFLLRRAVWRTAAGRVLRKPGARFALAILSLYAVTALLDVPAWRDDRLDRPRTLLDRLTGRPVERTYSAPMAAFTTVEPTPHPLATRHLLGTDGTGEDVLHRTLKGCRTALTLALGTSLIATPLALALGLLAGYHGRWLDDLIQYVVTVVASIPSILLLIALMMVLGRGIPQLCLALGVTSWVRLYRLTRAETLKLRERDYVRAARALGVRVSSILRRHILPNLLPTVVISLTLGMSELVLAEAILSYLHLGVPPGVGSWGNMIDAARVELTREPVIWWNLAAASTALFFLVLAFNLLGDALRDALDPRLAEGP